MALDVINGRRVLIFERHCWALRDLNARDKLAFFNAMLEYGTDGTTEFQGRQGIVRMMMPEVVALSRSSDRNAERKRLARATKRGRTADEARTDEGRTADEARTDEGRTADEARTDEGRTADEARAKKKKKVTCPKGHEEGAHLRAPLRRPSVDQVLDFADSHNWLQHAPGLTVEQLHDRLREIHADMEAVGWTDPEGRELSNWRTFLLKKVVASGKKNCAAAPVPEVPILRFNPEAM